MKVIVDLHAVEGSQNGNDHSATRDGYTEWGDSYISKTVAVVDFLAERFYWIEIICLKMVSHFLSQSLMLCHII